MKEEFIEWARNNGWDVFEDHDKAELPEHIKERYTIPETWYEFIARISLFQNHDVTKWFLTPREYKNDLNEGFRWNEYELESLEWCDDPEPIKAFWDRYMPIFRSVDGEYSYYAIDTVTGNVLNGFEPEYEEATVVAEDFESFLKKIMSGEIEL